MTESKSDITGRDMYIVLQALAYAIETIERLPPECQEASEMEDMKALLSALCGPEQAAKYRTNAKRHLLRAEGITVTDPDPDKTEH